MKKRGAITPGNAWALVTGAGTGIGRCYALRLATLGYNLVIAGNNPDPLESVKKEIADIISLRPEEQRSEVHALSIDLARTEASEELYAAIKALGIEIEVLINNAGIFSFLDFLNTPAERLDRMILLHNMTLSKNCLAFGRDMAERKCGWILNMSSFSIWMPFPGMALYTATKAYVRQFSICLAKELCECGVRVTAVCPAGVATDLYGLPPYWQRIGIRLGALITADSCAHRGLRGLWSGHRTVVPDWWNRILIPICKFLPLWILRPIRRFTMKFQQ